MEVTRVKMTSLSSKVNRAIRGSKERYKNECIFCGVFRSPLEGAHIYPRKYVALTDNIDNIIPLCHRHHKALDRIAGMADRVSLIETGIAFEWRKRYQRQLSRLNEYIAKQNEEGKQIRWA